MWDTHAPRRDLTIPHPGTVFKEPPCGAEERNEELRISRGVGITEFGDPDFADERAVGKRIVQTSVVPSAVDFSV